MPFLSAAEWARRTVFANLVRAISQSQLEVMMKIVEHTLKMYAGKSWTDYIPSEDFVLRLGGDLATCRLTPAREMNLLVFVVASKLWAIN